MGVKQKMEILTKFKSCLVNNNDFVYLGRFGKTVGLKGEIKVHLDTDFLEQFIKNYPLYIGDKKDKLLLESFHLQKSTMRFIGYESIESVQAFTNKELYVTTEQTKQQCTLKEGEYFWFDLIGLKIIDGEVLLGDVIDVHRFAHTDYFEVQTSQELIAKGLPKMFMIPYLPNFIKSVHLDSKEIFCIGGMDILENS